MATTPTITAITTVPSVDKAKKIVRDWMTSNPMTTLPTTHLDEAYRLMHEARIRRLPVVQGGKLIGIVTLGDLRSLGADTDSEEIKKLRVDAVLHAEPVTVTTDTTLVEAARLMLHHKFSGLPVLSAGDESLVGVISESDILRAFIEDETR